MSNNIHPSNLLRRTSPITALYHLLRAMRLKQWVKNAPVFAGIVFAEGHLVAQVDLVMRVMVAFVLFCFTSSAVYLVNDLADIEKDRQHPRKRLRPLPAGDLSPTFVSIAAAVLILICLGVIGWQLLRGPELDRGWGWFGLILSIYFVLQLTYTFALKHIVLVDVFIIASGFVLRALAGAVVLSVHITAWWLLSVFFLALFLGLGKRRSELRVLTSEAGSHRPILEEYSLLFLDYLLLIVIACTIIVYSLATFTAPVAREMSYPFLMMTIPLVVFALFRYLYLIIQKGQGGEPADLLFQDRPFLITVVLWGIVVLAIQLARI